jgi:SAM-dependent methyltransferase
MSRFDADYWEDRYRGHGHAGPTRAHPALAEAVADRSPGAALEAGCGAGTNAIWLAGQGWQVTAVDIADSALRRGREAAQYGGVEVADRISWQQRDLTTWSPQEEGFDLVVSLYVHPAGPLPDFFGRLARAVAPGGTLLVVGHDPADPHAVAHGADAVSWTAGDVAEVLDPERWEVQVAHTVVRQEPGPYGEMVFHDAVLRANRR